MSTPIPNEPTQELPQTDWRQLGGPTSPDSPSTAGAQSFRRSNRLVRIGAFRGSIGDPDRRRRSPERHFRVDIPTNNGGPRASTLSSSDAATQKRQGGKF